MPLCPSPRTRWVLLFLWISKRQMQIPGFELLWTTWSPLQDSQLFIPPANDLVFPAPLNTLFDDCDSASSYDGLMRPQHKTAIAVEGTKLILHSINLCNRNMAPFSVFRHDFRPLQFFTFWLLLARHLFHNMTYSGLISGASACDMFQGQFMGLRYVRHANNIFRIWSLSGEINCLLSVCVFTKPYTIIRS